MAHQVTDTVSIRVIVLALSLTVHVHVHVYCTLSLMYSGLCIELNVSDEVVVLRNVSRSRDHAYECEAFNGILQPARRYMRVTVHCKFASH